MVTPAFFRAKGIAFAGAVVNHSGACCASAYPRMMAKGLMPSSSAFSLLINTTADAPSLSVEAFAAVTVPSLTKTGRRPGILSNLTALYSSSRSKNTDAPPFWGISTGTISFLNFPASVAVAAFL